MLTVGSIGQKAEHDSSKWPDWIVWHYVICTLAGLDWHQRRSCCG